MITIEQLERLDPEKITYDLPGLLYSLRACELIWRYIEQTGKTKDTAGIGYVLEKFTSGCPACSFHKTAVDIISSELDHYIPHCVCPLQCGWRILGKPCLQDGSTYKTNNAKDIADESKIRADAVEEAIKRGAE